MAQLARGGLARVPWLDSKATPHRFKRGQALQT